MQELEIKIWESLLQTRLSGKREHTEQAKKNKTQQKAEKYWYLRGEKRNRKLKASSIPEAKQKNFKKEVRAKS